MTTPNPGSTTAAILALLDAAAAIIQLPAHIRQQHIDAQTVQMLLDDAKSLDRALSQHPTAQNGPKRSEIEPRPANVPAPPRSPVLPPIPAATTKVEAANEIQRSNGIDKSYREPSGCPLSPVVPEEDRPRPSNRLPFAEFDRLCRAEMKRLSIDGRLPGHKLWNSECNPQLPTMAAVLLRYKAANLVELAEILGLQPPLSAAKESEL